MRQALSEYMMYATGIADGLRAAARRTTPRLTFTLRGPAGLFKSMEKHKLCWGLLNYCDLNLTQCPIDIITYHRKGIEGPSNILIDSIQLLSTIHKLHPNLKNVSYSNSEADPSAGWSKNVTSNTNVQYANSLIEIVFQHWNAIYDRSMGGLDSISHDNSFLSYHPFEFEQRTLLAMFSMNQTVPETIQFVQKPVYAALGMLGGLAKYSTKVYRESNISYILTSSDNYAAVLLTSSDDDNDRHINETEININIRNWATGRSTNFDREYAYFAEVLNSDQTDPYSIWMKYNRPSYPSMEVWSDMLHAQVRVSSNR